MWIIDPGSVPLLATIRVLIDSSIISSIITHDQGKITVTPARAEASLFIAKIAVPICMIVNADNSKNPPSPAWQLEIQKLSEGSAGIMITSNISMATEPVHSTRSVTDF